MTTVGETWTDLKQFNFVNKGGDHQFGTLLNIGYDSKDELIEEGVPEIVLAKVKIKTNMNTQGDSVRWIQGKDSFRRKDNSKKGCFIS
jgi:hypothetical protein